METFLADKLTLESALELFEENNLFGFDLEEVKYYVGKNFHMASSKKRSPEKNKPSKKTSVKTSKPRKPRERKKRTTRKQTSVPVKENKGEKKQDDSSYFETWKVPYVEP